MPPQNLAFEFVAENIYFFQKKSQNMDSSDREGPTMMVREADAASSSSSFAH